MILHLGLDPACASALGEAAADAGGAAVALADADELDARLAAPETWALVVGPHAGAPLPLVGRAKAARPDLAALVVADPAQHARLEHELLLAPFPGEPVRAVPAAAPAALRAHVARLAAARRARAVLRSVDARLREAPPPPRAEPVLDRVLASAPVGILVLDPGRRPVFHNRRARDLLALAADEPVERRFPPADRARVRELVEAAEARPQRFRLAGRDGERHVEILAGRTVGERPHVVLLAQDVTDLVRGEEELRRQKDLYATLLNAQSDLGEGFVLLEGERVAYVNDAMCRMTGYARDELERMPLHTLLDPRSRRPSPGTGGLQTVDVRAKDGRVVVLEVSVRAVGGEPPRVVVIARDVTERRAREAELERLRRESGRAERLAAMGGLVGGVAHEIRTPLTAIVNHLNLIALRLPRLAEEPALADQLPAHVAAALDASERINALVKDLRRFLHGETGERVPGPLDEPVAGAVRLFESTHPGGGRVDAQLDAKGHVSRDPSQVQQVVLNLLQNAAEASPPGAAVRVRLRDVDGGVELAVEDDGVGIPADVQARMFEPFVTTKPEGSGLGLSIVRRIAELHGATLRCESAPGRGTRFFIRFPLLSPLPVTSG